MWGMLLWGGAGVFSSLFLWMIIRRVKSSLNTQARTLAGWWILLELGEEFITVGEWFTQYKTGSEIVVFSCVLYYVYQTRDAYEITRWHKIALASLGVIWAVFLLVSIGYTYDLGISSWLMATTSILTMLATLLIVIVIPLSLHAQTELA